MKRVPQCPWVNRPTHRRNKKIRVSGEMPFVYGYCARDADCASCAGTTWKPNIDVKLGRSFDFVPCPYCSPAEYTRRVAEIHDLSAPKKDEEEEA